MNEYLLEYWNNTGCYKRETVYWKCSGDRYVLDQIGPNYSNYYIVAKKVK